MTSASVTVTSASESVTRWLSEFGDALTNRDVDRVAGMFAD